MDKIQIQAVFFQEKKGGFYSPKYFKKENNKVGTISEDQFQKLANQKNVQLLPPIYKDLA